MSLRSKLAERSRRREIAELESDLAAFFKAAWPILEPATPLVWSWVYSLVCEWLVLISEGQFRKRFPDLLGIIINFPFRSGKSTLICVWLVWSWLRYPHTRFLCASYSSALSSEHSLKRKRLIESRWFQERFGDRFALDPNRNRIDDFANDRGGSMTASSVGGTVTGFGAETLVGDDLNSQDDSYSPAVILATNRWNDGNWSTRTNDPARSVLVYISQRVHEDDVTGHLLSEQKGKYLHLRIPLEAEEDCEFIGPISGKSYKRRAGDVLFPERFTATVVASLKERGRVWSCQCQQSPSPETGGIIKRHWWRFYVRPGDPRPEGCVVLPAKFDESVQSWDMSFKGKESSDPVCGLLVHRLAAMKYVDADIVWERLNFPQTKKAVIAFSARHPEARRKFIEDRANGSGIIDELRTELSGLVAVEPAGSKEARLHAAAPDVESGNVILPHPSIAPWVPRFIDECASACCGGKHDDAADALSQAINKLRRAGGFLDGWVGQSLELIRQARESNPGKSFDEVVNSIGFTPAMGGPLHNLSLADAQMKEQHDRPGGVVFKRHGIFGEIERPVMQSGRLRDPNTRAHLPRNCPRCQKPLAVYDSGAKCNSCQWDSGKVTAPTPEPDVKKLTPAGEFLARFGV